MADLENKLFLTASEIYINIRQKIPIINVSVDERINLSLIEEKHQLEFGNSKGTYETIVEYPIIFKNCHLSSLVAQDVAFINTIILEKCILQEAGFSSCYATGGIIMTDCEVKSYMYLFAYGGHNAFDKPIKIINCTFDGFVNTEDAWFMGPVTISNCRFLKGTNLLANKGKPNETHFDVIPEIKENKGQLDLIRPIK
jgi:hypothetical protein